MFLFFYKIQDIEKIKALNFRVIGISESIKWFRTKKIHIQQWHLEIKTILAMSSPTSSTLLILKSKSYL